MTELTCSANTLRFADLPTRAAAAAGAGFTGIGLRLDDYRHSGHQDSRVRELLDEHALRILELEHTWDWAAGEPGPEEDTLFHLADTIGYRQLNVTMFEEHPPDEVTTAFGRLCDRAADHGLLVGLEFLPYSRVRTLAQAWRVVADADRDNGGVLLDLWHWHRTGTTPADLAGIPPGRITSLQLCDVLPQPMPDAKQEARHHRQLPGQGAGGTGAVVAALRRHGLRCPVSVEVFSDELDRLPPTEAAHRAATTGRRCLREGGWPG
ncbi:sugar phosphate isomerase/epimerase family protein [Streptomyces sp. NPDC091292]|uniref:sugar phosphate isomerase/epimerase family protein n=1 Tax=Streptomyces sp. NPDC091292 TaxID=3365991 RepID=UPI003818A971